MLPSTKAKAILEGHIYHGVRPNETVMRQLVDLVELSEAAANDPKPVRCPAALSMMALPSLVVEEMAKEFVLGKRTLAADEVAQLAVYIMALPKKGARCA